MMRRNYRLKSSLLAISISFFVFTIFVHHLSVEQVNVEQVHNRLVRFPHFKLTQDFPSALADEAPEIPSLSQNSQQDQKEPLLKEKNIVIVIGVVLFVVAVLLIMLLSPVVGTLDKATLKEKGEFLSESFPDVLQGVTVLLIVMVITLLSLVKVIDSQGTLSILSALIGYVLGKRASELEYKKPPGFPGNGQTKPQTKPSELKIKPSKDRLKFEEKIQIKIDPPQAVTVQIDPDLGKSQVINDSMIEYTAPSQAEAGDTTQVTLKVSSEDNPFLKTAEKIINLKS